MFKYKHLARIATGVCVAIIELYFYIAGPIII